VESSLQLGPTESWARMSDKSSNYGAVLPCACGTWVNYQDLFLNTPLMKSLTLHLLLKQADLNRWAQSIAHSLTIS
jgi:hypothetical protein